MRSRATRRAGAAERALLRSERAHGPSAWAETHAERGDFEYALKWLDIVRKSGGLSPQQLATRELWRSELEAGRPA